MVTRNNIYYDLSLSPYKADIEGVTYVFSSELHLYKFFDRMIRNEQRISASLSKRFGFTVHLPELSRVVHYLKTETRGFRILIGSEVITCPGNLQIVGQRISRAK